MRRPRRSSLAALLPVLACAPLAAQDAPSPPASVPAARATLQPADYGRWETLGNTELSRDGRWLAYEVQRVDGDVALLLRDTRSDSVIRTEHARGASFAPDSRWAAYSIGVPQAEQEKADKAQQVLKARLALVDLRAGTVSVEKDVASHAFSGDGRYLAMRGYAPTGTREHKGYDLVVRDLATGLDHNIGNVAEYAWQPEGALLALVIDAERKAGNGVRLFDPRTGIVRPLDTDTATYTGLAWRRRADDLAVFRVRKSDEFEGETHDVLAWTGLATSRPASHRLAALGYRGLPADTRIVTHRPLAWADDGGTVFVGTAEWERKAPKDTTAAAKDSAAAPEHAGVEVWHAADVDIIPEQKVRAPRDRQRNHLAAWLLEPRRLVALGDDVTEDVTLAASHRMAVGLDGTPYDRDRMFGPAYRDLYVIDVATGERTKVAERIEYQFGPSATGRYLLYLRDDHYWVYDRTTRRHTNLTAQVGAQFINVRDDHTVAQKPPWGNGGWLHDDSAVLLYDEYDIWQVKPDGSGGSRLTDGAAERVRHRRVYLDFEIDRFVDFSRPVYVTLYGDRTKQYGYGRLRRSGGVERLVFDDRNISRLTKARDADVYLYRAEAFDDPPDWFVAGPRLADARQVSETNPFQAEYAWARSELVDYVNARGDSLQAALHYPADYDPARKYPMVVYFYERTSSQLHTFSVPSERTAYNPTVFTQNGYFVLRPDITYRDRNPGLSAVEALLPAVDRVIALGLVDSARVGLVGHSWGAYQTVFTVTQTDRFAAAVAGAPLTNLISMYLSIYWNTGGTDARIFEISQGRMQVPPWEDLDAYMKNSPLFHIERLNTPLLVAFGDKDGAVDWHQGIELYNAARRAGKDMVMLVYEGENHSLAKKPNQIDYHRRIMQWFGHYLKGEPAASWITDGETYLERQKAIGK